MPTSRTGVVLIGAIVLYFFANQTQVGWLYVMGAVLAGTVLASWWLSRSMLRGVSGERMIGTGGALYEGDDVPISVTLTAARSGSAQIRLTEACPLAEPYSPQSAIKLYVPSLPSGGAVRFEYRVNIYKRGIYTFASLDLDSRAPFGFFKKLRSIDLPSPALVYPEVKPLSHLDLLDRQFAPEITRPSAGIGYEVMGLRAYRPGDSPRHIHWRTVARTGQLVSKEFADETQPGVLLALDLFKHPYAASQTKHTPFEWGVKLAASIGDYAIRRGYPLTLASNDASLPAPRGALAWEALLQILARVQPVGEVPLAQALANVPRQAFFVVILPYPDAGIAGYLRELHFQKVRVLAVILDPETFPTHSSLGQGAASKLASDLQAVGVETRLIHFGDDWTVQLQTDFAGVRQTL